MALSFSLNLTPNQIEFLQALELYEAKLIDISDVPCANACGNSIFVTFVKKLIREKLVEHYIPKEGERYKGGPGNGKIVQAYRITDKGRKVLEIIEKDVEEFIQRQQFYKELRKRKKVG